VARLPPALRPLWPYAKVLYTAATRIVAPAAQQLSRARGGYLPRRVAVSIDDAVARAGRMEVVRPAETVERDRPSGNPADHPVFVAQTREKVPRAAVCVLPWGRVLSPHAAVITGTGELVEELSPYFGTRRSSEHPLFLHPFPSPPTVIDDRLGVLATRGDGNYYHFLLDVLPRLGLFEQSATIEQPVRWYAPMATAFQRELFNLIGIEPADVLDSSTTTHVQAAELIVASLPDAHLRTPPWTVDFLRRRLLPPDAKRVPGKCIYVTRGSRRNSRIVVNETDVLNALSRFDFQVVDPGRLSVVEQIRAFAEAELIVAPHGAALANLAFASPGAAVIELLAPDFVQACYWKLAGCVPGLRYRYLIGDGRQSRPDRMRGVASDIDVDPTAVMRMLDALSSLGDESRAVC
jgi:capsular polysaccharide biosynthesis protein